MDNKTWLWRKRSSEKTIVANNKSDFSSQGIEEEILATEKEASLERSLENLNEKLASVICEVNAKDELLARHAKMAEEAIADREKAEAASVSLKQELDKALQQKISSNERLTQLNAALKESMHQLSLVREEQEQRIRDAVMKTSKEFEKAQKKLEEKLTEKSEMLANLTVENSRLSKAFLVNEKLMEDLSKHKSQAEVEFNTLMARLDSVEKENAFLKYEFRMLEKELEIRNEEIEFNRLSADVSHKQHMESEKKISKLEAECQRLRVLVRNRLPGPAALAKMKSEVEILGQNQSEMRRRKLNPITGSLIVRDSGIGNPPDIPNKKISFLIERLYDVEEENKTLKENLVKKEDELHFSQIVCAQTASKLSTVEAQLGELSKGEKSTELAHKIFGVSDMSLMDDFVEMEKLAIVTVDTPMGNSYTSLDASNVLAISSDESGGYHLDPRGKELVPVVQGQSSDIEQEIQTKDESTRKGYDWLQDVLKLILDQNHASKRSFDDLLEDIRIGLSYMNYSCDSEANKEESSNHPAASAPIPISGYITWKSPNISLKVGSLDGVPHSETWVEETTDQHSQSNMNSSIRKTIELIRRIDPACLQNGYVPDNGLERDGSTSPFKLLPTPSEYLVCVFRWKSSELGTVLQQFVRTCDDLLDGKVKFENFAAELTSALDWIINNCIISRDVSIVRDEIKKRLDFDKSPSASKLGGVDGPFSESDKVHRSEEHSTHVWEENMGLKDELKNMSSQKDLEARLRSANDKSEALMNQVRESERSIGNLQMELKSLKESKGMVEDQMESQKLINEDLDTQLTVTKVKLKEVVHKLSSLEVELDDKCQCCEELKATCLELQLQLESITSKEVLKDNIDQEERLLQTGWEITAASAKLAECQETILNLGKQLNALASPRETSVFNKVVSTTNNKKLRQWSPLRDRMLAEDDAETGDLNSPKTKEIIRSTVEAKKPSIPEACIGSKHEAHTAAAVGSLAIVPSKKRSGGVGFLRKLLMRRKRGNIKKTSRSFAT